jgi:hypothetical protein
MGKIFKGQTALKIEVLTGTDLTLATDQEIKFIKPSGATGSFAATVSDATGGIIYYDVDSADDLDQSGEWTFWAYITFPSGVVPGEASKVEIYEEGDIS